MLDKKYKNIIIALAVSITLACTIYIIGSEDIISNILRTRTENNAYAEVTLVSPDNYARVGLPVTATVHVITNATNPLIQFTFKYIDDNGYTNYYKSIRFSFSNDTDISYTPTFDSSYIDKSFTWYVVVFNGSSAIWHNDENAWHFTTTEFGVNQPPVADAGGPYSGNINKTITFDGSNSYDSDGTITSYQWDLNGDGIYDFSGQIVSVKYSNAGNYTVTLKVTDDSGTSSTDTTYALISSYYSPFLPSSPQTGNSKLILYIIISSIVSLLVIGSVLYKKMEVD
ncbi:MAG: PKD domain-containing protein [Thermoplasmata archaeon]|nr:PKD domain-containing protein [Thermoplasmata archaeon]